VKTYLCYAKVVATVWLGTVEAETEAEALEQASDLSLRKHITLCHQCSDQIDGPTIDEPFVEEQS
jgi:hypothetical protein